jgi:hypothetical protein
VTNAPKGLRVFFAAHSLMRHVPTPLGEMATAAGIEDHQLVGIQFLGASRTLQHWGVPEERNKPKQAIKKGEVEVLVMSPIQFPDPGIENFVKLGLERTSARRCDRRALGIRSRSDDEPPVCQGVRSSPGVSRSRTILTSSRAFDEVTAIRDSPAWSCGGKRLREVLHRQ